MRTTLDISDAVLFAAKEIVRRDGKILGQVTTDLLRQTFVQLPDAQGPAYIVSEPLAKRGGLVSNELIDRLCGKDGA